MDNMDEMSTSVRVSLTEAKQRLGDFAKRAAYGGETVVLEFRGKPVAAIVSYEELQKMGGEKEKDRIEYGREVLADLRALRERGAVYRTADFDSTEEIRELREGEAHEFPDLPGQ